MLLTGRTRIPDRSRLSVLLRSEEALVLAMILTGTLLRLVLAQTTRGLAFDIESWTAVRRALSHSALHLYAQVNPRPLYHWPYPPGFLLFVPPVALLSDVLGVGFGHLIRLPSILADGAIAWLVWWGLGTRFTRSERLLGAALVVFGPVFIAISSYAAQIDSFAILPAVIALLVWEREAGRRRAWIAGALIGVAATVKTVPLAMLLALAPSARSWRELAELVLSAVAVLFASLLPFLIADAAGVLGIAHYTGVPGMGGLSLVIQPDFAQIWLTRLVHPSGLESWLFERHAALLNGVALGAFAVYAAWFRPRPRIAATVLWLVVLALGSAFFFQYLVWGLPFFLLAGYLRTTAALQALITAPMLIFYLGPWRSGAIVYPFVALMITAWVAWVAALALLSRHRATA
jgi:hypothetical protein